MSNTEHELPKQEIKNSEERTSLEILNSKRMWDKAGTGFSIPYQKPSQTTRSWKHTDILKECNEDLGIKTTSSDSSSSDENSIEITFFKKKQ
ncbi:MAG: hypothetical protein WCK67_08455 [bacterium]